MITKSTFVTNAVAIWIKSASGKPNIVTMANGKYIGNIKCYEYEN